MQIFQVQSETYRNILLILGGIFWSGAGLAHAALTVDDAWVKKNGSVVSGTFEGTVLQAAITIVTTKSVTVTKARVRGPGDLIKIGRGASVKVSNTIGSSTNPNVSGTQKGAFVTATAPASLGVQNCTVSGMRFGVLVTGFSGRGAQTVSITQNIFNNIDGRPSDGKGGYDRENVNVRAHAIQLNGVQHVPGMEIAWNQIMQQPFQGQVNDTINIYSSSGLKSSHLNIHDNYIQGALPRSPDGSGFAYSGGGIITDGKAADTADTATAWVDIYNNQVTQTANYGIATAAGHDNTVYGNRVVSAGKLANGPIYATRSAPGYYNWNAQKQSASVFYGNHVHDNLSGLLKMNKNNSTLLERNDWYLPGQNYATENNQHFQPNTAAAPTVADEGSEYKRWKDKLGGKAIGALTRLPNT